MSLASSGALLSQQGALDFIPVIDASLGQILQMRSQIGAVQNVLGFTASVAQVSADSLESSRSAIVDADLATESANLARGQILQQAGVALLTQVNQTPKSILTLLQSTLAR